MSEGSSGETGAAILRLAIIKSRQDPSNFFRSFPESALKTHLYMSGTFYNTSRLNFVLQGEMGVAAAWIISLETQREHRSNYLVRPSASPLQCGSSAFILRRVFVHLLTEKIMSFLIVFPFNI